MAWRYWVAAVLVAWWVLTLAFLVGYEMGDDDVDCPTEDSCTVDYRDGEWHIEEVSP